MSSAQHIRARLSYDVYNSTSINPRTFLQGRFNNLADAVFALVNDEALDNSQLLDFAAEFESLVERYEHAADARRHPNSMSSQSFGARESFDSGFASHHSSRAISTALSHGSIYSDIVSPIATLPDTPASVASDATSVQLAGSCRCHICSRETDPNPSTARYPSLKREHDIHVLQWLHRDWCTPAIRSIMRDCALPDAVRPEDLLHAILDAIKTRWTELPVYFRLAFERVLAVDYKLQTLIDLNVITLHTLHPVGPTAQAEAEAEAQLSISEKKKHTEATRAILHCLHHQFGESEMIDEPMPKKHRSKPRRRNSITLARNRQFAQNTSARLPPLQERGTNAQPPCPVASSSAGPAGVMDDNTPPLPSINGTAMPMEMEWQHDATP